MAAVVPATTAASLFRCPGGSGSGFAGGAAATDGEGPSSVGRSRGAEEFVAPHHTPLPAPPDAPAPLLLEAAHESVRRAQALRWVRTTAPTNPTSNTSGDNSPRTTPNEDSQQQREEALRLYRSAAEIYQSFELRVLTAQCWLAMGELLSGNSSSKEEAVVCFLQAEQLLRHCYNHQKRKQQQQQQSSPQRNQQGQPITSSKSSSSNMEPPQPEDGDSAATADDDATAEQDENVDILIVEALQKRARVHQDEHAIVCHQDIVTFLLDVHQTSSHSHSNSSHRFHPQHAVLLLQSLEQLGMYYQQFPNCVQLSVFEAAMSVLRGQQQLSGSILVTLALLYVQERNLDAAVQALEEALDLLSPPDRTKALSSMEVVGRSFEEAACYDQAMACYEKVLLHRSQLYGSTNLLVAQSLVNVARIMELQGNLEGSLDLYRAAQSIYTSKLASSSVDVEEDDVKVLLELFPTAMEQGRYKEAVAYLSKVIEVAESEDPGKSDFIDIDKTYIFYSLGKAYIGLKDYVSATICLLEAAKYEGEVSEEVVFALLQRVEFLQREAAASSQRNSGSSSDDSSYATASSRSDDGFDDNDDDAPAILAAVVPSVLRERRNHQIRRTMRDPVVEPLSPEPDSCGGSKAMNGYDEDDSDSDGEGTAYYDSESISVFDPVHRSDVSSSLFESEQLMIDSDALQVLDSPPPISIDNIPTESGELDESQLDTPDGDSLPLLETTAGEDGPTLPSLHHASSGSEGRTFSGFRLRLGSPRTKHDAGSAAKRSESSSSPPQPRGSLAKTLTGKFRRQRRIRAGFESMAEHDPLGHSLTPTSEEEEKTPSTVPTVPSAAEVKSPTSSLPSEEEYHSAIEGPVQYVTIRSKSFESCISQITLRFDDPTRTKDTSQEWWWNVTTEGIARWFPTAYVNKAVEAAEGFLSAKSIHAKVKQTPLEYVSDEEDTVEEKESSGGEVVDHPSYVGVADSKTLISGVEGRARAKLAEARREAALIQSPRSDGALSVYSSPPARHSKHLESEIARYSDLLDSQRAKYGKVHPEVATSLFTLAVLYSRNGAAAPAIEYAAEALGIQKATGRLADASRSLHFLADMYLHQSQYSTALSFYTEALRIERSHYGEFSDEAAMCLNCIGTVYSLQNEFLNAMESHQEALRILNELHDEDIKNPLISETLCQMGAVYYRERNSFSRNQGLSQEHFTTFVETGMLETIGRAHEDRGSYKLAISFFEEKLQLMENRGPISSDDELEEVATTLNSLGMLSSRAGFYVEAIDYYEKALKIQMKLGCDKVQIATARVLTGAVHFQLGDWQKALKLHQDALLVLKKELGTEHQTYAAALYQLGITRAALCEFDSAMSTLKQALGIQSRLLGNDQPATLRTRREISNLYATYPSNTGLALEQLDEILACQRLIHGDKHPNIAETLHSIGRAYSRGGDVSSAIQILEECYYMRTEFLGWDHPHQATTLHEVCQLHLKRGRTKKALHIVEVVLGILRESLSDDHIDVALALATKADCLLEEGKIEAAKKLIKDALKIAETTVGPQHPAVADVYVHLGTLQMRQCQFDAARTSIEKAIELYRTADVGDEYPGLVDALEKLDRVERDEMLCV